MNRPDPYAAFRQEQDAQAPYRLTATQQAIDALWAVLRFRRSDERLCLSQYRQMDGRPVGHLAQLSETDGRELRAALQARLAADRALADREAQP